MGSKSLSNRSVFLHGPFSLGYGEKPVPKIKDPHDVLVSVDYTGICGSDIHLWEGSDAGITRMNGPMVMGHESAGTVAEIGSEVKDLKVGDRVALEPGRPCRRCEQCLGGYYNLCPEMAFAACPPHDGTLTGFYLAPSAFCHKLPDNVSVQEGALVEPLAVAVHVVRQAAVKPGQTVAVMGAGPVGILCGAVARVFGASKVVAVDIVDTKLDFAKSFCATHTYKSQQSLSPEDNAAEIKKQAGLLTGADAVIEASGFESSIRCSLHLVRTGGTFVQCGMGKPNIQFPIMALCTKELTVKGSFRYGSGDYKLAVELLGSGAVQVKKLISQVVPFEQTEEAYKQVKGGQVMKILIAGPNQEL